jgi:hypothetical protein
MKSVRAITALGGACYLLSAFASPTAYAQEVKRQDAEETGIRSGPEKLFTYQVKLSGNGISGIGPDFDVAAGKVFEVNVSATCTYTSSDSHTITVRLHDLSNFADIPYTVRD